MKKGMHFFFCLRKKSLKEFDPIGEIVKNEIRKQNALDM